MQSSTWIRNSESYFAQKDHFYDTVILKNVHFKLLSLQYSTQTFFFWDAFKKFAAEAFEATRTSTSAVTSLLFSKNNKYSTLVWIIVLNEVCIRSSYSFSAGFSFYFLKANTLCLNSYEGCFRKFLCSWALIHTFKYGQNNKCQSLYYTLRKINVDLSKAYESN